MTFEINLSEEAHRVYLRLEEEHPAKSRKVQKALALMQTNLRSPSLQTHKLETLKGPDGEDMFEAYVENRTPGAFRIFWHYGPGKGVITVTSIIPHP